MKILVIGGGGREHAVAKSLMKNVAVEKIWVAPGNGGTAAFCENVDIAATDLKGILNFCLEHNPDFVVVTPDDPLALGMVDLLEENGFPCFGPTRAAAQLEWSKSFAKQFMEKYNIPTAKCVLCKDAKEAKAYAKECPIPIVLKADGLAQGKGVVIAMTREEAVAAQAQLSYGKNDQAILFEEMLVGPEVSVLCFTDGKTIVPMPAAQDHKRAYDGDKGPNTGGMGAYSPVSVYTKEMAERCMEEIYLPTIRGMEAEGTPFKGVLYFSLMLTQDGPKVIEYNSRFGDPETQVVLPLLNSDLFDIMVAVRNGKLDRARVKFSDACSACVVLASGGYPSAYEKGKPITGLEEAENHGTIYHAGTKRLDDGSYVTSGGRVLCVSSTGRSLRQALRKSYKGIEAIKFEGAFYRKDIGSKDASLSKED
ncbi:MAG: phosphoribosylamine--glycine ligase [Clostridia bacterium]|nr:phosphoribosylamine--glycine ligase [Clostridia bacterium]